MIAELICVGTELLMGQVVNTNARFIAEKLAPLGITMYYQVVVGDNVGRLTQVVKTALARADILIFCGGLGPTDDDLTKETVAAAMDLPLVLRTDEWDKIVSYFTEKGREVSPNNKKQALFPPDALVLDNPFGTAPGCILEQDGKAAILLPGPPREMIPMFGAHVEPWLLARSDTRLYTREVRVFGMGEADVAQKLSSLIENQSNPTIAPYVKPGEVTLRLTAGCDSEDEGRALVEPVLAQIREILGDLVYSDTGRSLPETCHDLFLQAGKTLAVAESCTGGLLASAFVDIPGSSAYFIEGAVTYANEAKVKRLGVSRDTLDKYGAVSAECAREMAQGMRRTSGADIALATTGIAGPDGGTVDKPVGLVYVALATEENVTVQEWRLYGERARVRGLTVLYALDLLRRFFFS
ncbi:MAG: competence/damage-inducible protein A [Clostridiales bacterium]|nr:competence/damage-inducible protein A [Clostridiales bacterium]